MARSVHGTTHCPMPHRLKPSSSLEGMEKPVRSFKAFIKTAPPNPTPLRNAVQQKLLPPIPALPPPRSQTPSLPGPSKRPTTQPVRNPTALSWGRPSEWSRTMSNGNIVPASAVPTDPEYSLLLPEPSPDPFGSYMDMMSGDENLGHQQSRLPTMERSNAGLGGPSSPPNPPLPAIPPKSPARIAAIAASRSPPSGRSSFNRRTSDSLSLSIPRNMTQPELPRSATPSSVRSARSSRDKAYAPLVIAESKEQSDDLTNDQYRHTEASINDGMSSVLERQDTQNNMAVSASRETFLQDESSDSDDSTDERVRHLDALQDYHDVLVDQYMRSKASTSENPKPGAIDSVIGPSSNLSHLKTPPGDEHLVPHPLSWRKDSSPDVCRGFFSKGADENNFWGLRKGAMFPPKKKGTWMPGRLSISHGFSNRPFLEGNKTKTKTPESLRFNKFFHPSRPTRWRRGSVRSNGAERGPRVKTRSAEPTGAIPSLPLGPFPGLGIAVTAAPHPTSPPKKKEQPPPGSSNPSVPKASPGKVPTEAGDRPYIPNPPAISHSEGVRIANYIGSPSGDQNATEIPPRPATSGDADPFRTSGFSCVSRFSGSSTYSNEDQDDISELRPSRRKAKGFKGRRRSTNFGNVWKNSTGFIGKVREKRHKQDEDVRHDQFKKNLQILRPTDPETVARYVNRGGKLEYEPRGGG